jgi:hypothetical protein
MKLGLLADCHRVLARVGPTTPTQFRMSLATSVDPTEARKAIVRRFGRSNRRA